MDKNSHSLHSLHSEFSRTLRFVSEAFYEYMRTIGPPSLFTPVEQKKRKEQETNKETKEKKQRLKEEKRQNTNVFLLAIDWVQEMKLLLL